MQFKKIIIYYTIYFLILTSLFFFLKLLKYYLYLEKNDTIYSEAEKLQKLSNVPREIGALCNDLRKAVKEKSDLINGKKVKVEVNPEEKNLETQGEHLHSIIIII